ncbi:MAG: LexA family transcriptional regulator [Nitrospinae bacterium]|nr:LexA family transcriptional regulator [Nitrospinota bacterium]
MSRKKLPDNHFFHKTLPKLRKNKGLGQKEFANKIGFSQSYISLIEDGLKQPSEKFIKAVENYWGIKFEENKEIARADNNELIYIPAVKGRIGAGGGFEPDNTIELKLAFRKEWIEQRGNPKNMSLIRVHGDSMEPTLFSGDLLLIDHNQNHIDTYGGIYAISVNNEIMIKRLQLIRSEKKIKVISDNEKYQPEFFDPKEITINGKLIWFAREYEK